MKFIKQTILIMICMFFFLFPLLGQEKKSNKNRLDNIRRNIENYRKKIQKEKQKEIQLLDALSNLDREIDLTNELISELKKEDKKKSHLIVKIGKNLRTKQAELKRLQNLYSKRVVAYYKFGKTRDIELLLDSKSFNQALIWLKFQKLLAQNDKRNYLKILEKKKKVERKKNELKDELITKRQIINEKTEEEINLKHRSLERNKLLARVQKNKQAYLNKLKEYEHSAKEIQRLISVEVDKRLTMEKDGVFQSSDFPSLRGRMAWPTRGRIITHFGKQKHPKWKTVTENIGIDIESDFGQDVRTVSKGVVTAITWQRGRGNIVIVNHFEGYFTVYTHLSEIVVQIDETIEAGHVIGSVGDSGSLKGPLLHFEIWKDDQYLNPEKWLI